MAKLFKINVTEPIDVKPENGKTFTLQELYKIIDCSMVEFVYLDKYIMIIDEEGKLNNKSVNDVATYHFRKLTNEHDYIVGNALICDRSEIN
jgi:hypothetical protein|tara:strand:- start:3325 stop:3600 length:276 start_codon:yes stop_codon:yes gene_type:complete